MKTNISILLLLFSCILLRAQNKVFTQTNYKVLIVLPSNNKLLDTSEIDSYSLSSVMDCYATLKSKGIAVDFAKSGNREPNISTLAIDEINHYGATAHYYKLENIGKQIKHTIHLNAIDPAAYNAILCLGGLTSIQDFYNNTKLHTIIRTIYEKGGVVSALSNAVSSLINVELSSGISLIKGKKITSMTTPELLAGYRLKKDSILKLIPFLVEEKLKEKQVDYQSAKRNFENRVIADNRIITGGYAGSSAQNLAREIANRILPPSKKILIVVTSNDRLLNGNPAGFYLPEVIDFHHIISNGGNFEFDIASPKGGKAPMYNESYFLNNTAYKKYLLETGLILKLTNTIPLSKINSTDYAAIHFAGGFAALTDFPSDTSLKKITRDVYENQGLISAVCHGPSALLNLRLSNGKYLLDGKKVTSRTEEEETYGGSTKKDILKRFPIILEDEIKKQGAIFTKGAAFEGYIVSDQRIVTGQGVPSTTPLAKEILKQLKS